MAIVSTDHRATSVSLKQAAQIIIALDGKMPVLLRGERGSGKSSIMAILERHYGDAYEYVYYDMASKDVCDSLMPSINREKGETDFYPSALLKPHSTKPIAYLFDEWGKAPLMVQNALHPMIERRNRRLGDQLMHPKSIVILTSNTAKEALGDTIKAHTLDRLMDLPVRKPNADQWLEWGMTNNIHPAVLAWVHQYPECLASFEDGDQSNNAFIPFPGKVQGKCVTARGLDMMSDFCYARDLVDTDSFIVGGTGIIGNAASLSFDAYLTYQDQLPRWEDIVKNPTGVLVPESMGACMVLVFGAITKIDPSSIGPFMKYVQRMPLEWQAVFATSVAASPQQRIAFHDKGFTDWVRENQWVL